MQNSVPQLDGQHDTSDEEEEEEEEDDNDDDDNEDKEEEENDENEAGAEEVNFLLIKLLAGWSQLVH